jgi:hypothetical protein
MLIFNYFNIATCMKELGFHVYSQREEWSDDRDILTEADYQVFDPRAPLQSPEETSVIDFELTKIGNEDINGRNVEKYRVKTANDSEWHRQKTCTFGIEYNSDGSSSVENLLREVTDCFFQENPGYRVEDESQLETNMPDFGGESTKK